MLIEAGACRTEEIRILVARTRLHTLTASGLGTQLSIRGNVQSPKSWFDLEPLLAQVLEHRPALQRLTKLTEQADHAVQYEQASRMPEVPLLGNSHREAGIGAGDHPTSPGSPCRARRVTVFETGLLKQTEQTVTVARTSFRQGAASLLNVLDAQRVSRQTVSELVQVRADLSIALVRLERPVGASQ